MDEILKDERFSHIVRDPRFKRLPKKEKKVTIDKRFSSMFTDKRFKVKYTVDKRGRRADHTSSEDLKRYYNLPSSSGSDGETSSIEQSAEEQKQEQKLKRKKKKKVVEEVENEDLSDGSKENLSDSESDNENDQVDQKGLTQKVKVKLRNLTIDYARGEGVLFTDSSSGEESDGESEVSSDEELDHGWGELDKDAESTNEVTNRLAVCNMDWDRIRATDLMVLFNSFLPKGGVIQSITIYPSEFGLQRMKEEEVKGPTELFANKSDDENDDKNDDDDDEMEEGRKYHMEKLRQYQLNRLKYYYAVLVCDSPETANKLYTDCDGLEYESSATRLDLRFIPDDTTFDQEPRELCDRLPELSKYQPRYFTTTALQQAKVELTWDETDPGRAEITQKLMSGKVDDVEDEDIKAYLALSSDGEQEEEEENEQVENDGKEEDDETSSQADPISKYRALLEGIEQEEERKKAQDIEVEVTWGIGLKDKTEKLVQQKLKENGPSLTPFQQYLEKRKEKSRKKREERRKLKEQNGDVGSEDSEDEGKAFSDDGLPSDVDLNDPYFKEEMEGFEKTSKKKNKDRSKKKGKEESENEEEKQKQAELELLLMNDTDEKHHFNLKAIQDQETESKSKRRRKKKKKDKTQAEQMNDADDFQVNVNDERFSALFSSHLFNIDPADPHYRKTKAMEALRVEKLKRRQQEEEIPVKIQRLESSKKSDPELSLLVKKIKRRSENFKK